MDATRDYYIKLSKSEREIHIFYHFMWNPKYYINELTYKTEIDSQIERRDMVARGRGEGWTRSLRLADANYNI